MAETVYSIKEVAQILKVSEDTVRRLIDSGDLEAFRVGNQYRITQSSLDRFMQKKS